MLRGGMAAIDFYSAVLGTNPKAAAIVAMLRHAQPESESRACLFDFPRYRDAYFAYDADGTAHIVVLTRTGGGNRSSFVAENAAITKHPLYVRDEDDAFDATYALWWFDIPPQESAAAIDDLVTNGPGLGVKAKVDLAIKQLQETKQVPDVSGISVVDSDGVRTNLQEALKGVFR